MDSLEIFENLSPIDNWGLNKETIKKQLELTGIISLYPETLFVLENERIKKSTNLNLGLVVNIKKMGSLRKIAIRCSKKVNGQNLGLFGLWKEPNFGVGDVILFSFQQIGDEYGNRLKGYIHYTQFKNQSWYYDLETIDNSPEKLFFDITGKNQYKFNGRWKIKGYYSSSLMKYLKVVK